MSAAKRRLGKKYDLYERLAHGGQGEVWKARDTQLERDVAIKILRTDVQHDPDFVMRFEREAQLVASLRHPNIVQLHDFQISEPPESEEPTPYMVMDYVPGPTLAGYIRTTSRKGQIPSAGDIMHIFTAVCLGLDYAHGKGMIHRDIKPANIMLDERFRTVNPMGEPVLTDFGIARLQGLATGTVVGSMLGTPLYISPEQAQGRHGDRRSDLYSLGVILYEIVTGITPFRGESTMAILMQHLYDLPTPPSLINPKIPATLSSVILKNLAKHPEERYDSATQMAIALAGALQVPVPAALLAGPRGTSIALSSSLSPSSVLTPPDSAALYPANPGPYRTPSPGSTPVLYPPTPSGPAQLAAQTPQAPFIRPIPSQQFSGPAIQQNQFTPPQPPPERDGRGKAPLIMLIIAILLAVIGGGVGIYTILGNNGTPSATITGTVHFSRSSHATPGSYDQLKIDLSNVPPPQGGSTYYAWLDGQTVEAQRPYWKLTYTEGHLRSDGDVSFKATNLLRSDYILLITQEPPQSIANGAVIPNIDPQNRLYFVQLSPTKTDYEIQQCTIKNKYNQTCSK